MLLPFLVDLSAIDVARDAQDVSSIESWCQSIAKACRSCLSRHVFTAKAVFAPLAGIIFFIWAIVKAKGVGPIIHQPGTLHGSALGWQMVIATMSCVSNMATLITNAPDFASCVGHFPGSNASSLKLLLMLIVERTDLAMLSGRRSLESLSASPSYHSSGSSSRPRPRLSTGSPCGRLLRSWGCSSTVTHRMRPDSASGLFLLRLFSLRYDLVPHIEVLWLTSWVCIRSERTLPRTLLALGELLHGSRNS